MKREVHDHGSALIRDVILGGQDGLVNVLGIVLAVATATSSTYIILISGLAATFAESISMAAVAYTSAKAGKEFYKKRERELKKLPPSGIRREVKKELKGVGIEGTFLNRAVKHVLGSRKRVQKALSLEEQAEEFAHPIRDAIVVGLAAIVGSLVPLIAFIGPLYSTMQTSIIITLLLSTLILFISGALKAEFTGVGHLKSGIEMAVVGMSAAILGYLIGLGLGAMPLA